MKGGGRKRVAQPKGEEGERGGEREHRRGKSGQQIVEREGPEEKKMEEEREEEEEGGEEEEERTKLDDGFYEIEAIRRKRVRKGQLQYLIKWRRWPETANTWEPLENLQSCSDVIDAFEESLHSGKHNRKRKRKYSGPHIQSKKKQTHSSGATYNETGHEFPLVPLDNADIADLPATCPVTVLACQGHSNGNANNVRKSNRVMENGSRNGSKRIYRRKDENDHDDAKISELEGTISSNGLNDDKLAKRFQGGKPSQGNGLANGLAKVDHMESVQSDRRGGAKRRKSGSVKRYKQDLSSSGSNLTQNVLPNILVGYGTPDAQIGIENLGLTVDGLSRRPLSDNYANVPAITKILKPVGLSASVSDNTQDVSVNFLAIRSDGQEVMVDNRYLKTNNPVLLINFYEQHLKYTPPS
ncbi:hypothetical protein PTKIN_Ptkin01aG0386900 [Pterospermum kingtungense]